MLKSIKVKNFKGISETSIELRDLSGMNIIIGGNNSGKTAILEALWLVGEIIFKIHGNYVRNVDELVVSGASLSGDAFARARQLLPNLLNLNELVHLKGDIFEIEFGLRLSDAFIPNLKKIIPSLENPQIYSTAEHKVGDLRMCRVNYLFNLKGMRSQITSIVWGNTNLLSTNNQSRFFNVEKFIQSTGAGTYDGANGQAFYQELFKELNRLLGAMNVYYVPSKRKINEVIGSTDNSVEIKGENLKKELFKLYHGETKEVERYSKILRIFKSITGKDIREKPYINRTNNYVDVVFTEKNIVDVSIDNSGYGYYQLLSLIYNIVKTDSNVILVDEPEISLHPQAQIKFFEAIKKLSQDENIQFIFSTHSPYFIDLKEIDKVYKISKDTDSCNVRKLNDVNVIDTIKNKRDGIFPFRNRELFFMNRVVFVEGVNDLDRLTKIINENFGKNLVNEDLYSLNGINLEKLNLYGKFCDELKIEARFISDFDFLIKDSSYEKGFKTVIQSIKDKDVKILEFFGMIEKERTKDDNNKVKDFWCKEWSSIWKQAEVQIFIKEFRGKGIYIMPFMDVKGIDVDTTLVPEVIEILKQIEISFS